MNEVAPPSGVAGNDRAARPGRSGRSPLRLPTILIVGTFAVLFAVLGFGTYGLITKSRPDLADAASRIPKEVIGHPVDQILVGTVAPPMFWSDLKSIQFVPSSSVNTLGSIEPP